MRPVIGRAVIAVITRLTQTETIILAVIRKFYGVLIARKSNGGVILKISVSTDELFRNRCQNLSSCCITYELLVLKYFTLELFVCSLAKILEMLCLCLCILQGQMTRTALCHWIPVGKTR